MCRILFALKVLSLERIFFFISQIVTTCEGAVWRKRIYIFGFQAVGRLYYLSTRAESPIFLDGGVYSIFVRHKQTALSISHEFMCIVYHIPQQGATHNLSSSHSVRGNNIPLASPKMRARITL